MRIAVDFTPVHTPGVLNYYKNFAANFASSAGRHSLYYFLSSSCPVLDLPPSCTTINVGVAASLLRRLLWQQVVLPQLLRDLKIDVLFTPFNIAPLRAPCPVLLAVRNPTALLVDLNLAKKVPFFRGLVHQWLVSASTKLAKKVFFPSQFAAQLLGDFHEIPDDKRAVVYHGCDGAFWSRESKDQGAAQVLEHKGLKSGAYFLFVSKFYGYKFPDVFLRGFKVFIDKFPELSEGLKAVFVGERDVQDIEAYRKMTQELGVAERCVFLQKIPGIELAALYQNSLGFVFPSVMETFGQPLVEALNAGCLILAADTAFARELCGDCAEYFAPMDTEGLAKLMANTFQEVGGRSGLSMRAIARGKQFSWRREAEETLALIEEVQNRFPRTFV